MLGEGLASRWQKLGRREDLSSKHTLSVVEHLKKSAPFVMHDFAVHDRPLSAKVTGILHHAPIQQPTIDRETKNGPTITFCNYTECFGFGV